MAGVQDEKIWPPHIIFISISQSYTTEVKDRDVHTNIHIPNNSKPSYIVIFGLVFDSIQQEPWGQPT